MSVNFNTELDVYKELKAKIEADTKDIKRVLKFTDMANTVKELENVGSGLTSNEIWCAVDFLPKFDKTISGTRSNVVLIHLFIGANIGDGLYIADEQVRRALNGFSGTVIKRCLYSNSSDLFKEKKWDAWTRHLRFNIEWKSD